MIVHLNGDWVPAAEATVSVFDGGYMYGDGVYTTLRLYGGVPLDLDAHHARLARHAAELQIVCPLGVKRLREIIAGLVARNDLGGADGRLRISLSRGGDPRHTLPLTGLTGIPTTVLMTLAPVAPELARWQADGIPVIRLAEGFARGNFPDLKTLNGLATVTALRLAAAAGCPEALFTGPDGRLLEGAVSNIFLVSGDHLLTPAIEGGFLAGRTRERILRIAREAGIEVRQKILDQRHLAAACEVFVVSSVREVLPVVMIDSEPVGDGKPGPYTRRVQGDYRALITAELQAG